MRSFSDVQIFEIVDRIGEHLEIESFVIICLIFYEIVIAENTTFEALCIGKCTKNIEHFFFFKRISKLQSLFEAAVVSIKGLSRLFSPYTIENYLNIVIFNKSANELSHGSFQLWIDTLIADNAFLYEEIN